MADGETRMSSDDPEVAVASNEDGRPNPGFMGQRWVFIRKIYTILAIQLLLAVGISAVFEATIPDVLMIHTVPGAVVYILILAVPFIILWALHANESQYPQNLVLLVCFTVAMAVAIGLSCSFARGRNFLLVLILSSAAVVALLLYTFWAEKKGNDINSFINPLMRSTFPFVLILFTLLRAIVHLEELNSTVYGCLLTVIFSSFVIYETEKLIKNFKDDEYIAASVSIYLDPIKLFLDKLLAEGVNRNTGSDEGSAGEARN